MRVAWAATVPTRARPSIAEPSASSSRELAGHVRRDRLAQLRARQHQPRGARGLQHLRVRGEEGTYRSQRGATLLLDLGGRAQDQRAQVRQLRLALALAPQGLAVADRLRWIAQAAHQERQRPAVPERQVGAVPGLAPQPRRDRVVQLQDALALHARRVEEVARRRLQARGHRPLAASVPAVAHRAFLLEQRLRPAQVGRLPGRGGEPVDPQEVGAQGAGRPGDFSCIGAGFHGRTHPARLRQQCGLFGARGQLRQQRLRLAGELLQPLVFRAIEHRAAAHDEGVVDADVLHPEDDALRDFLLARRRAGRAAQAEAHREREQTQPLQEPSAGCVRSFHGGKEVVPA